MHHFPSLGTLFSPQLEFHELPESFEYQISVGVAGVVLSVTLNPGSSGNRATSAKNGGMSQMNRRKRARMLQRSSLSGGTPRKQRGKAGRAGQKCQGGGQPCPPVSLLTTVRTPSFSSGLAYEKQVTTGFTISQKLAVVFSGCSEPDLPVARRLFLDCVDRLFLMSVPVLRTVKPTADKNILSIRLLGIDVPPPVPRPILPRCIVPVSRLCKIYPGMPLGLMQSE